MRFCVSTIFASLGGSIDAHSGLVSTKSVLGKYESASPNEHDSTFESILFLEHMFFTEIFKIVDVPIPFPHTHNILIIVKSPIDLISGRIVLTLPLDFMFYLCRLCRNGDPEHLTDYFQNKCDAEPNGRIVGGTLPPR